MLRPCSAGVVLVWCWCEVEVKAKTVLSNTEHTAAASLSAMLTSKKRLRLCAVLDNDAVSVSLCHFLPLLTLLCVIRRVSANGFLRSALICSDHRHLGEAMIDSFQVHLGSQVRRAAILLVNLAPLVLQLAPLVRISHDRQLLACEST